MGKNKTFEKIKRNLENNIIQLKEDITRAFDDGTNPLQEVDDFEEVTIEMIKEEISHNK